MWLVWQDCYADIVAAFAHLMQVQVCGKRYSKLPLAVWLCSYITISSLIAMLTNACDV
jgi:hypothetical protein